MKNLAIPAAIMTCLASLLGGCVPPGQADLAVLTDYQKALMHRSPQERQAEQGPGQLKPAPQRGLPELKSVTDAKTGRTLVYLPLEEAIVRALANSLDIRLVSFDPAIAHEQAVAAAAAFDYIVFGAANYNKQDVQPSNTFTSGQTKTWSYQAGIKQTTITGANWSLAYTLTGTRESASAFTTLPKFYEAEATLQVTQPLLRNAWWQFNLAQLRLAQVNEKVSAEAFRQRVEETVTTVIDGYWTLIQARFDLAIQEQLLRSTMETLERVKARSELDATRVQIKQAEAAVESRRASIILARKTVQDAQDAFARLLADPQINLLDDFELVPTTNPVSEEVQIDLTDRLITALKHNPILAQARLAIEAADINVYIAKNQTLPKLDLTASTTFQGLDVRPHQADENLATGDYASYAVGLTAEYPIGNRAALADLRRQKLTRRRALTQVQNLTDQVAQDLKERVRQVSTTYQEMLAQRAAVAAAKLQLQALEDTERIRGKLTPEFLQLKLQAQEAVATAQRAELAAMVQYNAAMADVDRASGTVLQVQRVRIALPPATDLAGWVAPETTPAPAPSAAPTVIDSYRHVLTGGEKTGK